MRTGLTIVLLCFACFAATAQNHREPDKQRAAAWAAFKAEVDKDGKDCAEAKNQYEDTICTAQVAEAADKDLNLFFQYVKSVMTGEDQEKLQASQDAWVGYRKKACDAVYDFFAGGTIRNSAQARCEIRLTRERMRDLNDFYETPLYH